MNIFSIHTEQDFHDAALEIFRKQASENPVYSEYLSNLGIKVSEIHHQEEIPFLPIEFFKTRKIITGKGATELIFESSGTTGQTPGKHHVLSAEIYQKSFINHFTQKYGDPAEWCIIALLPSYIERGNSSLVYMMDHLISLSMHPDSGFYLRDLRSVRKILDTRKSDNKPALLLGVSFALLELSENYPGSIGTNTIVMETGGMKGRRKELTRTEFHSILAGAFEIEAVHSEYGMTELLSQAYSKGEGILHPPPWMKVFIRDIYDPLSLRKLGEAGGINIIDLANYRSCSFIATGDLGKVYPDGSFEVNGRIDQAEVRGCNLMAI